MEIKHGRLSMAAFLGVITTYSGLRFPGYLSLAEEIKFSDIPGGAISSWAVRALVFFFMLCFGHANAVAPPRLVRPPSEFPHSLT
jgi:light-harvesting complex I chlorophyll a/b binding protein 1